MNKPSTPPHGPGASSPAFCSALPIPRALYPCKICRDEYSRYADDLYWSEREKDWVCTDCFGEENVGERGIRLDKEIERQNAGHSAAQTKHTDALAELYRAHGVGETTAHKLAFWKSQHPGGYSISHDPTEEQEVAVMETSWLCDEFPNDFEMC